MNPRFIVRVNTRPVRFGNASANMLTERPTIQTKSNTPWIWDTQPNDFLPKAPPPPPPSKARARLLSNNKRSKKLIPLHIANCFGLFNNAYSHTGWHLALKPDTETTDTLQKENSRPLNMLCLSCSYHCKIVA